MGPAEWTLDRLGLPLEGEGTILLFLLLIPPTSFSPPIIVVVCFLSGCLTFWIHIFEAGISISFGFFNVRLF